VTDAAPLILTLRFDAAGFSRFQAQRRRLFPPERNLVPAHLTLFHHLPGARHDEISAALSAVAAAQPPFALAVSALRFLGQGTAYAAASPPLAALRDGLAMRWRELLTRQDAQPFRPHVTIQNKVAPEQAKAAFAQLSASFRPFEVQATGLLLWRYRGGPWESAGEFPFAAVNR
jgi:2'-5' RNA ligase